jgi:hypothetical protein
MKLIFEEMKQEYEERKSLEVDITRLTKVILIYIIIVLVRINES